ncbi:CHD5-like protein [Lasiodiplodia theobromae]|uniref:CHD5-like protein n=2 Tax=Lasiodiplodia TaxID=66739 RepID=A0A8H7MBW2_9PEZI|nr:CHD5-like protein [Lasiodiplodia theobromae]KAF4546376.1 CHD5-like protein [Lasiodiplodia theobromae]KAF9630517.1 CHD5-like protein [Lasiodiplodia theobromae]KAK0653540.1 Protein GET1 [Lasiodiplodia hormozganensis]
MASLLLIIFAVSLITHLLSSVPAATLNELLWILYNKLPTPTSTAAREQAKLKREVLRLKKEMNAVSAQDDFAKWAKLRRAHDKAFADFQKNDSALRSARASFDTAVASVRWLVTNGLRFFLQLWYAKQPLFWIPQGWVPGYVEWILAFPKAPTGSVSVQIWGIACASVISLLSEALIALYALATGKMLSKENAKPQPTPAAGSERKEL